MKKENKCQCGGKRAKLWHLVCEDCWKQLPGDLQTEVYHAYKTDNGGPTHRVAVRNVFEFLKCQKAHIQHTQAEHAAASLEEAKQPRHECSPELAEYLERKPILQVKIIVEDLGDGVVSIVAESDSEINERTAKSCALQLAAHLMEYGRGLVLGTMKMKEVA